MKIGVRAHDFSQNGTLDNLVAPLKTHEVECIQLALYKALDYKLDTFVEKDAEFVGKKLQNVNIDIEVLGCYINPINEDEIELKTECERFLKHIDFAKIMGAKLVGTETGSINKNLTYNPQNHTHQSYLKLLKSLEIFAQKAEQAGVNIGIEAVHNLVLYSPQKTHEMLKDMACENIKIIFDPVNLLYSENYVNHLEVVREAFSLYADKIKAIHVKDFVFDKKVKEVLLGQGLFNYAQFFNLTKEYAVEANLLLEGYIPENYTCARDVLRSIIQRS